MSQAIANPNEDKDDLLRNLSQFVSSASLLENEDSNQTGEYLQQLSLQLRQQLDEVNVSRTFSCSILIENLRCILLF